MIIRRALAVAAVLLLIVVWELAARSSFFLTLLLSSPTRLAAYFQEHATVLAADFAHTVAIAGGGLLVALSVGSLIAVAGLRYRSAAGVLEGASTAAQSVPLVVFAPFSILIFGVGSISQIALAAIMAIFPWIIGLIAAVRVSRAEFDELLLLYDVPFLARLHQVYLPHSLPSLVAALRVSAALAVLGAVIAEFTGSAVGLGRNIFLGTVRLDPELIMSALILTASLGIVVHLILSRLERRASWWR